MAGKKFWFANLPSKKGGADSSVDLNTARGAHNLLSKASEWYNSITGNSLKGVDTVNSLLSSSIELNSNEISAWTRSSKSLANSELNRSITSYPKSFWYTVQTRQALATGTMGTDGNPLQSANLIHPFKNLAWDVYITKIIVVTDIKGAAAGGTYSIGLTTNNTSHSNEISGTHGLIDTYVDADTVQVIVPNSIGHNAILNPWKVTHNLGLVPNVAASTENWKGKIYIECFAPELHSEGLSEFVDDPLSGKIMKEFI